MVDRKVYNCILSQVFSPCGDLLLCGNIFGDIGIFDLKSVLKEEECPDKLPKLIFKSPNGEQICSLASAERFLIAGTAGAIFSWDWDSVKALKPNLAWTIPLPTSNERLQKTEVNSMFVAKDDQFNQLYTGCGDNLIYAISLEDGKIIRKFSGHTDYIHSISNFGQQMASASEDGSVRLWDLRQPTMTSIIHPSKEPKLMRPHLGKWIGDVDITQDWLVCGGGPSLSLWHMRTLEMMTRFEETKDNGIHVAQLHGGWVLAGGTDSHFYQLSYTGEVLSKLHTSPPTVYSALYTDSPSEVLSLAGASGDIDICTNFTYRHQVLSFFP